MSKKIEVRNLTKRNMKMIVPIDGEIEIDDKGIVELSVECAELLVTKGKGWKYPHKADDLTEEDVEQFLNGLELNDLKKLAIQNKLHKHEVGKEFWSEENKEKDTLITYINKYMSEDLKIAINAIIEEES